MVCPEKQMGQEQKSETDISIYLKTWNTKRRKIFLDGVSVSVSGQSVSDSKVKGHHFWISMMILYLYCYRTSWMQILWKYPESSFQIQFKYEGTIYLGMSSQYQCWVSMWFNFQSQEHKRQYFEFGGQKIQDIIKG